MYCFWWWLATWQRTEISRGRWMPVGGNPTSICAKKKKEGKNHYRENPHILIKPSLNKDITLFFWLWTKWASKDWAREHIHAHTHNDAHHSATDAFQTRSVRFNTSSVNRCKYTVLLSHILTDGASFRVLTLSINIFWRNIELAGATTICKQHERKGKLQRQSNVALNEPRRCELRFT